MNNNNKSDEPNFLKGNLPFDEEPSLDKNLNDTYTYSDFKFDKSKISNNKKPKENDIFNFNNPNRNKGVNPTPNNKSTSQVPLKTMNQFELRNQLRNQKTPTQIEKISVEQMQQAEAERKARLEQIMQQNQSNRPSAKEQRLTKNQIQQQIDINNRKKSNDPNIINGKRKPLKPEYNQDFGGGSNGGGGKPPFQGLKSNKDKKPKTNKKPGRFNKKRIAAIVLIILLFLAAALLSSIVIIKNTAKPLHLTVIGVDQRKGQKEEEIRADAIMNINVGSKDNKILMASIPRDTYTTVPCEQAQDKITHAYSYGAMNWKDKGGGIACTVDAVEDLIKVPDTDKYVKVNFQNMVGIIDAIGGIDHKPTATFCEQDSKGKKDKYCFEKGKKIHMNGEQALAYSRHRKSDSDIARGLRQQEILKAMANKVKNANILQWPGMFTKVSSMIQTNLSTPELMQIAIVYATKGKIESYKFDWSGVMYGGVSYVELGQDSLNEYTKKVSALN